jgi:hypothetical protein
MSDGAGDSGEPEACCIEVFGQVCVAQAARPSVGVSMRVRPLTPRSYSHQDRWVTTPVSTILEDTPTRVLFETKSGPAYEWQIIGGMRIL